MTASVLIALPVATSLLCAAPLVGRHARWALLVTSLACAGLGVSAIVGDVADVDALAAMLVVVAALGFAVAALASARVGDARWHCGLLALCLAATNGALVAHDLLLFFACWEISLVALTLLASSGVRGGDVVARFAGPVAVLDALMLAAFVSIAAIRGSADVGLLAARPLPAGAQLLPLLLVLPALAARLGVFPLHTITAALHDRAPDSVRVVLVPALALPSASAIARIGLALFPDALALIAPALVALAAAGAAYLAAVATRRSEERSLGAALGLAQQNVAALGLFTATVTTVAGAMLSLIALAPAFGAFVVASRTLTRGARAAVVTAALGGLVAIPGSGAFAGALLTLAGAYGRYPVAAGVATIALVLGALAALGFVRRTLQGPTAARQRRTSPGEWLLIASLLSVVLVLGVAPTIVTDRVPADLVGGPR